MVECWYLGGITEIPLSCHPPVTITIRTKDSLTCFSFWSAECLMEWQLWMEERTLGPSYRGWRIETFDQLFHFFFFYHVFSQILFSLTDFLSTSDISTLQLSSTIINHVFLFLVSIFFSMYPSPYLTDTNQQCQRKLRDQKLCSLCSWDCVQVRGDILFWVCCVKSDSEIRRDIGQIVLLPGLKRCQPTLASWHLKL